MRISRRLVAVITLALLTAALFGLVERWDVRGPQMVVNADFEPDGPGWTVRADRGAATLRDGSATLETRDPGGQTLLIQRIDALGAGTHVRVSADLRASIDEEGVDPLLIVSLVQLGTDGRRRSDTYHPNLFATEDRAWARRSAVTFVPASTTELLVRPLLRHASGEMSVRNIEVVPVRERGMFRVLRLTLAAAWLVASSWVCLRWLRIRHRRAWRTVAVLAGLATAVLTIAPKPVLDGLPRRLAAASHELEPIPPPESDGEKNAASADETDETDDNAPPPDNAEAASRSKPSRSRTPPPSQAAQETPSVARQNEAPPLRPGGDSASTRPDPEADGDDDAKERSWLPDLVRGKLAAVAGALARYLDEDETKKHGHFVAFALLALFVRLAASRTVPAFFFLEMPALAAVLELVQHFEISRTPSLFDAGINIVGTLVGLGLGTLFRRSGKENTRGEPGT